MDEFDKMCDTVAAMEKPFGVSQDQWDMLQGGMAALRKSKDDAATKIADLEARLATLEAKG